MGDFDFMEYSSYTELFMYIMVGLIFVLLGVFTFLFSLKILESNDDLLIKIIFICLGVLLLTLVSIFSIRTIYYSVKYLYKKCFNGGLK